ncbi:sensor histidine kinase [Paenibacillus arenilitoris]|uniref:Histidine kinase n=1 Tax=Paenibacillus arenilitoris TaxID=2772299 RepID=A0A927H3X5_9BACL|nr:sensor histidine kinase [Paenibacillus arenilitoris]MBD2867320.1 histidine kinase [Paenibacillus arenilitoris]
MVKYKVFQRLLIMLAFLLIPATVLFAYANHASKDVVKKTLESSASKQMEFTIQQMEQSLRQLEKQTLLLASDASIQSYASSWEFPEYLNHLLMRKTIEEKLELQSQAEPLIHELTVYWPSIEEVISTSRQAQYDLEELARKPANEWFAQERDGVLTFRLLLTNPSIVAPDWSNIVSVAETAISGDYLLSVLKGLDKTGNGKSFFYFAGRGLIANADIDRSLQDALMKENVLQAGASAHPNVTVFDIDGVEYLVQTMHSPSFGAMLVSYIELDEFLAPLQKVNWLVNGSLLFLFIAGVAISLLFYRNFRMPFGYLVRKIENLGTGDYGSRATLKTNTEFDYLFERFNDMASRTQTLIENVYEEKVRTREAEYKHLQSQINPHFLYNCLFYIVSMANKSPGAVISMAKNLSGFYRYITRKAGETTTLAEEIRLIESYLEVQSLRNTRLSYAIDIPSAMHGLPVPSLLLQPIVENAVVHGIEQKRDAGKILIRGAASGSLYVITVDDDGTGLSEEELKALGDRVHASYRTTDEMGCGLRNVHHRLANRYGNHSGLSFSGNVWGGFRVTLHITNTKQEESE